MPFKWKSSKRIGDPISEATRRLEKNPRDVIALMDRAGAYLAHRDAESALSDIERSRQIVLLEPKLEREARSVLLSRLYTMQSRALAGLGDWSGALAAVEKALSERSDDVSALVQRGRIRRDSRDLQSAMSDLDRAIELDDSAASAYVARGMTRRELGDYKGALADYDQALKLDKTLAIAWSSRARLHLDLNDLQRAGRDCRTAIRLDPQLVFAYTNLAWIVRNQGNLDEALRVLTQGLKQHPNEPNLLVELARTYIERNRLSEALSALDAVLRNSPDCGEALALRGQVRGRSGNLTAALADLGQAVELDPHNPETHFNHALAHWHAGNPSEALAAASRVIQLTPSDQEARAWRTRLALLLGLNSLDVVAGVLEGFAYSHCGPGRRWKVELRQMHLFRPDGSPETFDAALLDLCQTPQALLQVTATPTEYTVKILEERAVPGAPRPCLFDALSETIPAQADALLDLLNSFIDKGFLVKTGDQLKHVGKV